jgi:hypothetical protein
MRWPRNLLAFIHWGGGVVLAGIGSLVAALACDEGCGGGGNWSRDANAWQWDAVELLALAVIALLTFYFVAALLGRLGLASLFLLLQVMATMSAFAFLAAADAITIAPGVTLLILVTEATGVLALFAGRKRFSDL